MTKLKKMNLDRELKKAASAITVISLGIKRYMEYDPLSTRTMNSAEKSATRCSEVLKSLRQSIWYLLQHRVRFYLGVEVLAAAAQLLVELIRRLVEPALFVIYVLICISICMYQQSVISYYSKEYVVLIEIIQLFVQFFQKSHIQHIFSTNTSLTIFKKIQITLKKAM